MSTLISLGIALEVDHCDEAQATAAPLLSQMQTGAYDEMSVLPVPLNLDEWRAEHRTARKRADRARHRGYWVREFERAEWADHIHAINTSTNVRQGRPMTNGYRTHSDYPRLPEYPCPRHAIRTTGVFGADDDTEALFGYLVMIRAGELALVSQILGHADRLQDEIMYLLFEHALQREIDADPGCLVVYNRHDSGTDGLRFFKERLGFQPMPVEWLP